MKQIPHDHSLALKSAESRLVERYLLAAPTPRRRGESKQFVVETRHWRDARNAKKPSANWAH